MLKRLILLTLLIIGLALPAQAQDVITIPIPFEAYTYRVSPDGTQAAVHADAVFYQFEGDPNVFSILLIDLESGEVASELEGTHTDYAVDTAFSPDGQQLISLHANGRLFVWNLETGEAIAEKNLMLGSTRLHVTDNHIVVLGGGIPSNILVLDRETLHITDVFNYPFATRQHFMDNYTRAPANFDITYSSVAATDNTVFASTGNDAIMAWDIDSGVMEQIKQPNEEFGRLSIRVMTINDGKLTAIMNRIGIGIYDVETGNLVEQIDLPDLFSTAISPDGSTVYWVDRETSAIYRTSAADPDLSASETVLSSERATELIGSSRIFPMQNGNLQFTPNALLVGGILNRGEGESVLLVIDLEGN